MICKPFQLQYLGSNHFYLWYLKTSIYFDLPVSLNLTQKLNCQIDPYISKTSKCAFIHSIKNWYIRLRLLYHDADDINCFKKKKERKCFHTHRRSFALFLCCFTFLAGCQVFQICATVVYLFSIEKRQDISLLIQSFTLQ